MESRGAWPQVPRKEENVELEKQEIKKGVGFTGIETTKFKTDLIAVFVTIPIERKTVTLDCLVPAVLRRGTQNMQTQIEISKALENMYGASFDCGIDKIADNHIIKFYIETVNDNFLPQKEEVLNQALNTMFEILFNPLTENGLFKQEYVEQEKKNIERIIEAKIDNKDQYATERISEIMYEGKPYGLYKYGYIEDLETITNKQVFDRYQEIIKTAKIDIFVSGEIDKKQVTDVIRKNENISKLQDREPNYIINNEETEKKEKLEKVNIQEEKLDIGQGKLIIGLDVLNSKKEDRFATIMYNVIFGESATSKLFQNVREKASLAYTARSSYVRQKNNIIIKCGIEIENYEKAVKIIKEQITSMEKGEFTEEDIEMAKRYMINGIKTIKEGQDTEITYYIGQELSGYTISLEQYEEKVQKVKKEDILKIANNLQINTIYFLRN